MDPSTVNDGFHHQLIPQYRDQSAAYGISSSSSSALMLPDPAGLAVFWHHHPPLPLPPAQDNQMPVPFPYHIPPAYTHDTQEDSVPLGGREKRHCCQLCDKRFDRPSTLKKHMLVHTGEKAWACEICGRRFSVSSNLNRHVRRCKEKWAKSDSLATDTPPILSDPSEHTESPPSSSSPSSTDGSDPCSPSSPQQMIHRRQSVPGPVTDHGPRSHDQHHVAGKPQRRRRKGSPVEPWVPASLVNFNLEPITRSVPTPLPAVVPSMFEERNSYADTPSQAYHPSCWTGRLVGPSYVPRNEEVSGGRIYGKLLVF